MIIVAVGCREISGNLGNSRMGRDSMHFGVTRRSTRSTAIPCLSFLPHFGAMPDQQGQQDNQQELILAVLRVVDVIVEQLSDILIDHYTRRRRAPPTPYHTSALSGSDWVDELLSGHPRRIRNELGINRGTFTLLRRALQGLDIDSSRHVSIEEQLSIFLYTAVTGMGCIHVGERFQRSSNTVTK
jgi:hypothetical protein